jgi:hypothetical protein
MVAMTDTPQRGGRRPSLTRKNGKHATVTATLGSR